MNTKIKLNGSQNWIKMNKDLIEWLKELNWMNEDKLNEYENYIEGIRIELNNIAI